MANYLFFGLGNIWTRDMLSIGYFSRKVLFTVKCNFKIHVNKIFSEEIASRIKGFQGMIIAIQTHYMFQVKGLPERWQHPLWL